MVQTGLALFVSQSPVIAMSYFESQQSIGTFKLVFTANGGLLVYFRRVQLLHFILHWFLSYREALVWSAKLVFVRFWNNLKKNRYLTNSS